MHSCRMMAATLSENDQGHKCGAHCSRTQGHDEQASNRSAEWLPGCQDVSAAAPSETVTRTSHGDTLPETPLLGFIIVRPHNCPSAAQPEAHAALSTQKSLIMRAFDLEAPQGNRKISSPAGGCLREAVIPAPSFARKLVAGR